MHFAHKDAGIVDFGLVTRLLPDTSDDFDAESLLLLPLDEELVQAFRWRIVTYSQDDLRSRGSTKRPDNLRPEQ